MMNDMEMQEPERGPQSSQEWQVSQPYGEYRAEYPGRYEPEPVQQQKIYPQAESEQRGAGALLGIVAILLSSLGFFIRTRTRTLLHSIVKHHQEGGERFKSLPYSVVKVHQISFNSFSICIVAFLHIVSPLQAYDAWYMLAWTMLKSGGKRIQLNSQYDVYYDEVKAGVSAERYKPNWRAQK